MLHFCLPKRQYFDDFGGYYEKQTMPLNETTFSMCKYSTISEGVSPECFTSLDRFILIKDEPKV